MKFYKRTFTIEVVDESSIPRNFEAYQKKRGLLWDDTVYIHAGKQLQLSQKETVQLLLEWGIDPEKLLLDKDGKWINEKRKR